MQDKHNFMLNLENKENRYFLKKTGNKQISENIRE